MLLYITHTTTYHYVPQVTTAQHMAHLLPRSDAAQTVQHAELHITPTPATTSTHVDVFGNNRTFFSLPVVHDTLSITAKSTVETHFIPYPP
jgi:transglutaminase-like putative cysteine protease